MKILVIGCGSIGKRHIRNLVFIKAKEILAFDIDKTKLKGVKNISSFIKASDSLDKLWKENPKIIFICVPTSLHIKYALEAAKRGCHLFIEKPLSNNYKNINSLLNIIKQKELVTLVGCNIRFYWAISKIKKLLREEIIGKIISARIETGQYLPDWHPWEDYRKMYSGRKELGGGIILDAIHEIDYAMWFFGDVKNVFSMYGKLSNLEIETEDIAEILLKFRNGPIVNIHMDYIQRSYSRGCKIIGETGTIYWDFGEHCIKLYSTETKKWRKFCEPKSYDSNQMYVDEIKYFLNCVGKKQTTFNNILYASEVLKIALAAKRKGTYIHA